MSMLRGIRKHSDSDQESAEKRRVCHSKNGSRYGSENGVHLLLAEQRPGECDTRGGGEHLAYPSGMADNKAGRHSKRCRIAGQPVGSGAGSRAQIVELSKGEN